MRAFFDGRVVQVQTSVGSTVSPAHRRVQVVALETFRVDLFLPVADANELTAGQTINMLVSTPFERVVPAKVIFRSSLIEAATVTTRVVLEIDNRELNLPAGFTVTLTDSL